MFTRLACCLFAWVALPVGAVTLPAPSGPLALQEAGNVDFIEAERALLADLNGDRDAVAPMLGLAELYLSRGMIPESRSVIEGLPKNKLADAQRARLSVLHAALSLVDGDRDDAALLDATEGWEDAAALRAHAAQEMGRTDAARALLTLAQAALPTLPVELRSLVLPTLLDIAIAAEDWDTGAALAAAYPEIPALADQPGYWLRLGRVAERRGDPLTAFEGYLRASRGDDADAHRARIALVRLGRGTGTLGRDQQRALLDQIRWAWRGDEVALDGLSLLAEVARETGDSLGALSALAQILRDFDDPAVRNNARARAETMIAAFYEAGATGGIGLSAFLDGHSHIEAEWRLDGMFHAHSGQLAKTLLERGMTAAAAREARNLREVMVVAEELGAMDPAPELALDLIQTELAAYLQSGRIDAASDLASTLTLPIEDTELTALLGELAARGGTAPVEGDARALQTRAERAFEAEDFETAHALYSEYWNLRPSSFAFRDAVRLMIAAYRSERPDTVARLSADIPRLTELPEWDEIAQSLSRALAPAEDPARRILSNAGTLASLERATRASDAAAAVTDGASP